jgi:sialate O-acetylesterase
MSHRFLIALFVLFSAAAKANVRLPAVIGNNMVLQRKSTIKLWGWADPNEKVVITASWNNRVDSTKGDASAKWQLAMETPAAGGPYTITIKGYNTIVLENVLVGEVWVCSGQSNMEMNYYWGLPQMREDIPSAANPNIRFFHVPKNTAVTPQQNGEGSWMQCDTNSVKWFSAVAYYFGKKLNADLNVPIGLIHASWGGTPAEVWTPAKTVENNPTLKQAAQKLNTSAHWPIMPGATFNAMIAPLTSYNIAGVIWYQGESNTGTASTYHELFPSMIKAWREGWAKEFPFYYVQLAPFNYGNNNIGALLREAQLKTLSVPKTGMVVTTDLADDTADIHPRNKKDVGLRLANLALANTYAQPIIGPGSPLYQSMTVNKNRVVLQFANAENGLMQKGKAIVGFFVAGNDKQFYPAQTKINGNSITVWSKEVKEPVAVRYAFSNTAIGNVFSKEGLPLSPFRTDDW